MRGRYPLRWQAGYCSTCQQAGSVLLCQHKGIKKNKINKTTYIIKYILAQQEHSASLQQMEFVSRTKNNNTSTASLHENDDLLLGGRQAK